MWQNTFWHWIWDGIANWVKSLKEKGIGRTIAEGSVIAGLRRIRRGKNVRGAKDEGGSREAKCEGGSREAKYKGGSHEAKDKGGSREAKRRSTANTLSRNSEKRSDQLTRVRALGSATYNGGSLCSSLSLARR